MRAILLGLLLVAGCYDSRGLGGEGIGAGGSPSLGSCADIGVQCGGVLGSRYCQHPGGAHIFYGECPCGPAMADGLVYETECIRNAGDSADICAVLCR